MFKFCFCYYFSPQICVQNDSIWASILEKSKHDLKHLVCSQRVCLVCLKWNDSLMYAFISFLPFVLSLHPFVWSVHCFRLLTFTSFVLFAALSSLFGTSPFLDYAAMLDVVRVVINHRSLMTVSNDCGRLTLGLSYTHTIYSCYCYCILSVSVAIPTHKFYAKFGFLHTHLWFCLCFYVMLLWFFYANFDYLSRFI